MNKRATIFLMIVLVIVYADCSHATSIWAKRGKDMKSIYADDVARKIGDILTIQISESSSVDNTSQRDLSKDTDRSTSFNGELGTVADIGEFGMTANSGNELSSTADFTDERSYVDSITVVVIDILPNNNLVIAGSRQRDIGGDKQIVEVSGIVRPSDISFDNIIQSEKIADFQIMTKSSGFSEPFTRPGWLGAILDFLWPF